jgi:hypothetical protein
MRAARPLLRIMAASLLAGLTATVALAHSWYEPDCCSDRDCAPVDGKYIELTPLGHVLRLPPGSHPMLKNATRTIQYIVPNGTSRPSRDQQYHVCLGAIVRVVPEPVPQKPKEPSVDELEVKCLYIPQAAS